MNLTQNAPKPLESHVASSQNLPDGIPSGARVEPCEFERLLQRAMEILNARARTAASSGS
jgi:hypothetical protein